MSARRAGLDRGSASIWVVSCCALLLVVAGVATVRALAVLARHRAESGADLAALAAAGRIGIDGDACAAAAHNARRNGVRLRSCRLRLGTDGRSGTVDVTVVLRAHLPVVGGRDVVAAARAGRLAGRLRQPPAAACPAASPLRQHIVAQSPARPGNPCGMLAGFAGRAS